MQWHFLAAARPRPAGCWLLTAWAPLVPSLCLLAIEPLATVEDGAAEYAMGSIAPLQEGQGGLGEKSVVRFIELCSASRNC